MVRVSVIIPVYNVGKYIRDCLDSVLGQTLKDIEVICVNDGSDDNSFEILKEYADKDKRLKIISNADNAGVTKARNIGLENSLGEYICFVDGDDWIGIDFIESLYRLACEFKVDAVLGAMTLAWEGKKEERYNKHEEGLYLGKEKISTLQNIYNVDNKEQLLKWSIWGNLYEKTQYYRHQIKVDERIRVGEDMAVLIPFIMDSKSIYITNITSYYYRQHEASVMHSKGSKAMDYYYLWEYLKPCLDNRPIIRQQIAHICCTGIESDYVNILKLKSQNFYMFPYERIPPHAEIVIFGAGLVGQAYYRQLEINNYCKVKLIVDNNYEQYTDEKYLVVSPSLIKNTIYDYILIAILNDELSKKIYNQLLHTYDIPAENIITHIPRMITDFVDLRQKY